MLIYFLLLLLLFITTINLIVARVAEGSMVFRNADWLMWMEKRRREYVQFMENV